MGLGKIIAGLGAMKQIIKESTFQNEAHENPEKAVDMLIEYNENPKLIEFARHLTDPQENEWLLNTFQYTRQALQIARETLPSQHVMRFADYLNQSEIFNMIAPQHYRGSAETQVLGPLIESCCPEDKKLDLLLKLEEKGHMQAIVKNYSSMQNADLFFNSIAKHQNRDVAKSVLNLSRSFNIAKQDPRFILDTAQVYPQYTDFVVR